MHRVCSPYHGLICKVYIWWVLLCGFHTDEIVPTLSHVNVKGVPTAGLALFNQTLLVCCLLITLMNYANAGILFQFSFSNKIINENQ